MVGEKIENLVPLSRNPSRVYIGKTFYDWCTKWPWIPWSLMSFSNLYPIDGNFPPTCVNCLQMRLPRSIWYDMAACVQTSRRPVLNLLIMALPFRPIQILFYCSGCVHRFFGHDSVSPFQCHRNNFEFARARTFGLPPTAVTVFRRWGCSTLVLVFCERYSRSLKADSSRCSVLPLIRVSVQQWISLAVVIY